MKRLWLHFICFLLCGFCLFGCSTTENETKNENTNRIVLEYEEKESSEVKSEMDFSQGDLYTMFAEVNNEEIDNFLYDDYNKDGIHEAFVITKKDGLYNLWYMSPAECKIVYENMESVDNQHTEILAFETRDYLLLQQAPMGSKGTLVYTIDNENQVSQPVISGRGYIHQNASGEIYFDVYEATDGKDNRKQPQYARYYLYYVYDEGFREYGGIPIGQEQFLKLDGAQEVLDHIYEEYSDAQLEISFLYRANHYINVNITAYQDDAIEYSNILLHYDSKKVSYVSEEFAKGKVEIAYMLSIATFPTAFKEPQNNNR